MQVLIQCRLIFAHALWADNILTQTDVGPLRKWRFVFVPEVEWIMERDA
jgi:hypothetical protein